MRTKIFHRAYFPVHARQSRPRRGRPRKIVAVNSSGCDSQHQKESKTKGELDKPSISTRLMSKSRKCISVVAVNDIVVESVQSINANIWCRIRLVKVYVPIIIITAFSHLVGLITNNY